MNNNKSQIKQPQNEKIEITYIKFPVFSNFKTFL